MLVRPTADILAEATGRVSSARTCLIGVDGPSGSGKSTFARRIALFAGAPVIEIDGFVSWQNFAGWWPRFEREVLVPLAEGRDIRYQVRDWTNDEFDDWLNGFKQLPWAPLIVIEGVTCTRSTAGHALTIRVWVEVEADVRLQRGIARDGESHRGLWLEWMRAEAEFRRN